MHAQLMPETLFLTINLIDRFLECKRVSRRNLQLVRGTLSICCDLHNAIDHTIEPPGRALCCMQLLAVMAAHLLAVQSQSYEPEWQ